MPGARIGGGKARVAPSVLAVLYKHGRPAQTEFAQWLKDTELTMCPIASEVTMPAAVLDRIAASGEGDALINARASELTCLRLYSVFKAYQDVEVGSRERMEAARVHERMQVEEQGELQLRRGVPEYLRRVSRARPGGR